MINLKTYAKYLGLITSGFCGKTVYLIIVPDNSFIGYTMRGDKKSCEIVISSTNDVYNNVNGKKSSDNTVKLYMMGVSVHECLHQIFTDFDTFIATCTQCAEKDFFGNVFNILEDPAIEYASPAVVGGKLLKSLDAMIAHCYKMAPEIKPTDSVISQVTAALIMIGDRGKPKGTFSDEAKAVYDKVYPIFQAGVCQKIGADRVKAAKEVYEILLPYYLKEKKAFEDLVKNLLPSSNPTSSNGNGNGSGSSGNGASNSNRSFGRGISLPITMPQSGTSEGDNSANGNNGSEESSKEAGNGKDEQKSSKDAENGNNTGESEGKAGDKSNSSSGSASSESGDEKSAEGKSSSDSSSNEKENKKSDGASEQNANRISRGLGGSDTESKSAATQELEFSEKELEEIREGEEDAKRRIDEEKRIEAKLAEQSAKDIPESTKTVTHVAPQKATAQDVEAYNKVLSEFQSKINVLKNDFRLIFRSDVGGKSYGSRGSKLCIERLATPNLREDVLMSRKKPKNVNDMAVYMLVDNSGSMSTEKKGVSNIQRAFELSVCLFEAFSSLKVPLYVAGFSTSLSGTTMYHQLTWRAPESYKYNLGEMRARAGNIDGDAIAVAREQLKKQGAKHKILVVISDGAPSGTRIGEKYISGEEYVKSEVDKTRKAGIDILGVALNCYSEETYDAMYSKNYIKASTANDIFKPLSVELKKIVKKWLD